MGALAEIYLKAETLQTILNVLAKKTGEDAKGAKITISIGDEVNQYGQNVSAFISQTKEQREAKKDKFYVANGKVFWTDGKISIAQKPEAQPSTAPLPEQEEDDLPF